MDNPHYEKAKDHLRRGIFDRAQIEASLAIALELSRINFNLAAN